MFHFRDILHAFEQEGREVNSKKKRFHEAAQANEVDGVSKSQDEPNLVS